MASTARITTWAVGLSVMLSLVCFALSTATAPGGAVGVVAPRDVFSGALSLESGALASLGVLILLLAPLARLIGVGVQLHSEGQRRLAAGAGLIVGLLVFSVGNLMLKTELGAKASESDSPR